MIVLVAAVIVWAWSERPTASPASPTKAVESHASPAPESAAALVREALAPLDPIERAVRLPDLVLPEARMARLVPAATVESLSADDRRHLEKGRMLSPDDRHGWLFAVPRQADGPGWFDVVEIGPPGSAGAVSTPSGGEPASIAPLALAAVLAVALVAWRWQRSRPARHASSPASIDRQALPHAGVGAAVASAPVAFEVAAAGDFAASPAAGLAEKAPAAHTHIPRESIAGEPVAEGLGAEEPVAEAPVVEAPVVEKPAVEEPVTENPFATEPVTEAPVASGPTAEEPAAAEPPAEGAATAPVAPHEPDLDTVHPQVEVTPAAAPDAGGADSPPGGGARADAIVLRPRGTEASGDVASRGPTTDEILSAAEPAEAVATPPPASVPARLPVAVDTVSPLGVVAETAALASRTPDPTRCPRPVEALDPLDASFQTPIEARETIVEWSASAPDTPDATATTPDSAAGSTQAAALETAVDAASRTEFPHRATEGVDLDAAAAADEPAGPRPLSAADAALIAALLGTTPDPLEAAALPSASPRLEEGDLAGLLRSEIGAWRARLHAERDDDAWLLTSTPTIDFDPRLEAPVPMDARVLPSAIRAMLRAATARAHRHVVVTARVERGQVVVEVDDDGGAPWRDTAGGLGLPEEVDAQAASEEGPDAALALTDVVARWHGGSATLAESPIGGRRVSMSWPAGGRVDRRRTRASDGDPSAATSARPRQRRRVRASGGLRAK